MKKNDSKKNNQDSPQDDVDQEVLPKKPYIIRNASIKDDFCNYTYEVKTGVGIGDVNDVKGAHIIMPTMSTTFGRLNVHLACIDDVFKHSKINIDDIDNFHAHELTDLYMVTGFKVKGSSENESVHLSGYKYVSSAGGRIAMETPKVMLDKLSSYQWYNELQEALDNARREVELYREGNYIPDEEDPEIEKNNKVVQMTIGDSAPAGKSNISDDQFENGKV